MTDAEKLRAMAAYIRKNGFSPRFRHGESTCGCFLRASYELFNTMQDKDCPGYRTLLEVVGTEDMDYGTLFEAGWIKAVESTADAAAACEIAADLVDELGE